MAQGNTTLAQVLDLQESSNILYAPTIKAISSKDPADSGALTIGLCNSTTSSNVTCYITGIATANNSSLFILQADGLTPYYPMNPASDGGSLLEDCAIPLGAVGTTTNVTVPYLAGARIWFCIAGKLTFTINPGADGAGPGLVEPSVGNTTDPNYLVQWDFCEFTFLATTLYANISYVDFVSIPIALTLTNTSGVVQHVSGLPSDGLDTVCSGLITQEGLDSAGWGQLVITNNGANDYWTPYITSVWEKYVTTPISVNTQVSYGIVTGTTSDSIWDFGTIGNFTRPTATEIFGATGTFNQASAEMDNIGARLNAGFNRSTLLIDAVQPDSEVVSTFYQNAITNHYGRIVHAANLDNGGYTFPYDDVGPADGSDTSGEVNDPNPLTFLITIGGGNATAKVRRRKAAPTKQSLVPKGPVMKTLVPSVKRLGRRSMMDWSAPQSAPAQLPAYADEMADLEYGMHPKMMGELRMGEETKPLHPLLERLFGKYLAKMRNVVYAARLRPVFDIIIAFIVSFLSLSIRAILSRVFLLVLVLIIYMFGLIPHGDVAEQGKIVELIMVDGSAMKLVNGSVSGLLVQQG